MGKPIYAYWDLRGLGEPARYLLYYTGADFEDKRYGRDGNDWPNDKFNLGLAFPNLPYYIDGDVKITQSTAILRYLARKHGLDGENASEKLRISLIEQQITDFRTTFFRLCYNEKFEEVKPEMVKNLPNEVKLLSKYLGNRKFFAGDSITYVDFMAFDTFDFYRYIAPDYLDEFPNIKEYFERMKHLPQLQKYLKSSTYKTWPIVGPLGFFAAKGPEPELE